MSENMERLYQERLNRYVTAMRNGKPDRVPIRPFVAEFVARHAGFSCQEVTHDYQKAFEGVLKCAGDFDWDAMVPNMVYVWTGLTEALGMRYYAVPGIGLSAQTGFQYLEPAEGQPFMRGDEYDALIDDPTGFLYNVWLPRVSRDVVPNGESSSFRSNVALVKGAMAMLSYFNAFGPQIGRMRSETGTVSAIAGIFKAPFDIIADKLRGYLGLVEDMQTQPDKVLEACEALMPYLYNVASNTADPEGNLPVGFWMHRGCVPFFSPQQFHSHYWPTLKPIIEELWGEGKQTLFYAEGDWKFHLETFRELPEASIVYHVDQGDIFKAHEVLGDRFCLSGGVPNVLLAFSSPQEVRAYCKKVIEGVAGDGGYIMDAGAIMQNDTRPENLRAMTEATHEFGVYSGVASTAPPPGPKPPERGEGYGMGDWRASARRRQPGVCVPWEEKKRELPLMQGDESIVQNVWENVDALGEMFIWQCLLSF